MKKCVMCGSKLKACLECGGYFHATNEKHVFCRSRCRTRKHRRLSVDANVNNETSEKGDLND